MADIFDILGPVMVGPSSSHTAGAVRIGLMARQIFGRQPQSARVYLHGSFAATGKGHGTDRALIAGLLGMQPDDLRIPDSFAHAQAANLEFSIEDTVIKGAHPNTARIVMHADGMQDMSVEACSVGGGRIRVCRLDEMDVNFTLESHTLIVRNADEPGRISDVTRVLSDEKINIASMQVFRDRRGGMAVMVVETDHIVPEEGLKMLESVPGIAQVRFVARS